MIGWLEGEVRQLWQRGARQGVLLVCHGVGYEVVLHQRFHGHVRGGAAAIGQSPRAGPVHPLAGGGGWLAALADCLTYSMRCVTNSPGTTYVTGLELRCSGAALGHGRAFLAAVTA